MGPNDESPSTHVSSQRVRLANVKMSDLADMIAKLDGVRRTTKDELAIGATEADWSPANSTTHTSLSAQTSISATC